jgi:hypothetical protein
MAVAESNELPAPVPDEEVESLSAAAPVLYGRDAELAAIVESQVPVLLVTGDALAIVDGHRGLPVRQWSSALAAALGVAVAEAFPRRPSSLSAARASV